MRRLLGLILTGGVIVGAAGLGTIYAAPEAGASLGVPGVSPGLSRGEAGASLGVPGVSPGPSRGEVGKKAERPSLVAIAIGALNEADGGHSIVDFRAAVRDGDAGGNLRFYCPEMGYYNGGVRTLSVENGVIKATGAGPLLRPDGRRTPVRYEAEINQASKRVTIRVHGREGVDYSMEGVLDPGLVKAGPPPTPSPHKEKHSKKEAS